MFLMSNNSTGSLKERVRGLLVFNQESTIIKKPVIDEANVQVEL